MQEALHLTYHYVRDRNAPGPNCAPSRLRTQITTLQESGYQILTCGEVARHLKENTPLPEKHATLSFDDGLKDQFTTAFPILKECGVPATFFYITCTLDNELPPVIGFQILIELLGAERLEKEILPKIFKGTPYVDLLDPKRYDASNRKMGEIPEFRRIKWMFNHWPSQAFKREKLDEIFAEYVSESSQEQYVREWFMKGSELREMAAAGMEIASHTVTHPALDITGLADIEHELATSKQRLADEIPGATISSFAWTFGGQFRLAARQLAGKYYASAWNGGLMSLDSMSETFYDDLMNIPRFDQTVFLPVS